MKNATVTVTTPPHSESIKLVTNNNPDFPDHFQLTQSDSMQEQTVTFHKSNIEDLINALQSLL